MTAATFHPKEIPRMKTNIRVSRYAPKNEADAEDFAWDASVEPEDRAWILFVPTTAAAARGVEPVLCLRVGSTHEDDHEAASYATQGSPEHIAFRASRP